MSRGPVLVTINAVAAHPPRSEATRGRMASVEVTAIALTPLGTVPKALMAERRGAPVTVALAWAVVVRLCLLSYQRSTPRLGSALGRVA